MVIVCSRVICLITASIVRATTQREDKKNSKQGSKSASAARSSQKQYMFRYSDCCYGDDESSVGG